MSKVTAYYHIVFCTKAREMTIPRTNREDLYRFIWKVIKENNCELIRVGGIQNHIHIFLNLHPTVALATLMQKIKGTSSVWMQSDNRFPSFRGWAKDYFACTLAPDGKAAMIEYIKNQETHHLGHPVKDEFAGMYRYADLDFDERDMN